MGPRTKRWKQAWLCLPSLPSNSHGFPCEALVFPIHATLTLAGLEVLIPKWEIVLPGDKVKVPLSYKLWLPRDHQVRRGVTILAMVIDRKQSLRRQSYTMGAGRNMCDTWVTHWAITWYFHAQFLWWMGKYSNLILRKSWWSGSDLVMWCWNQQRY